MANVYTIDDIIALYDALVYELQASRGYADSIREFIERARAAGMPEDAIETRVLLMYPELIGQRTETEAKYTALPLSAHACQVNVGRPSLLDTLRFAALENGCSVIVGPANAPGTDPFAVFDDGDIVIISGSSKSGNNRAYTVTKPPPATYNILRNPDLQVSTGTGTDRQPTYWNTSGTWGSGAGKSWELEDHVFTTLEKRDLQHQSTNTSASDNNTRVYQANSDMHIPLINGVTYLVSYKASFPTGSTDGIAPYVGNYTNVGSTQTADATVSAEEIVCVENPGEEMEFGFYPIGTGDTDVRLYDIVVTPKAATLDNPVLYLTESGSETVADDRGLTITLKER